MTLTIAICEAYVDYLKTGEYLLKRQHNGIGYYGHTRVGLFFQLQPPTVSWQVDANNPAAPQPGHDDEFIDAALAGVTEGLRLISELGIDTTSYSAHVTHAQMSLTDIEVSAVRAAAIMAVVDAFNLMDRVELAFVDGWTVITRTA